MNDIEIRQNFHRKRLRRQHEDKKTLVINELGLNHGECRADIAVINGHIVGYEIKSDRDSLGRLDEQVKSYNTVFDRVSIIVGERHSKSVQERVPEWWGLILSCRGARGAVNFHTLRKASTNASVDPVSLARLLWRNEAAEVLQQKGLPRKTIRQPRATLYQCMVEVLSTRELRMTISEYLKKRRNWRCPESLSLYDGSCQPVAT